MRENDEPTNPQFVLGNGKGSFLMCWTAIGPCMTDEIEHALRFTDYSTAIDESSRHYGLAGYDVIVLP